MTATDETPKGPSVSTRAFANFFQDKLRPAIDEVGKRKGSALKTSILLGAAVFAVFGIGTYMFFAPYAQMLGDHQITYWPILVLLPATLAVIAFSICYILSLRAVVRTFRENLVKRMAEYIDPDILHEANRAMPEDDILRGLLFESAGKPIPGSDLFRGRAGGARVEFTDLRLASATDRKGGEVWSGLFFRATFDRRFRTFMLSLPDGDTVSLSGLSEKLRDSGELKSDLVRLDDAGARRQTVVESDRQDLAGSAVGRGRWPEVLRELNGRGVRTLVGFRGSVLSIAMLSLRERLDMPGVFDGFDFGSCREFCRDARFCLELARETADNGELFAE